MNDQIGVIDCTLRDGGYHINWDFPESLVKNYLKSMDDSHVKLIELGFRNPPEHSYRGKYYYTPEPFVENAAELFSGEMGLMIDAKAYLELPDPVRALQKNFPDSANSNIKFVRVAVNLLEVKAALKLVDTLKTRGYRVFLNIMKVSEIDMSVLESQISSMDKTELVEGLILADTFGKLLPDQYAKICKSLTSNFSFTIGVHPHNNRNLALANSLACLDAGAKYFDCTVSGMGRGPGNAETENFLAALERETDQENSNYDPQPVSKCSFIDFEPLKSVSPWGYSSLYLQSARKAVHPSYAQELIDGQLSRPRQWQMMEMLGRSEERATYSRGTAVLASNSTDVQSQDEVFFSESNPLKSFSKIRSQFSGKPVVVIGGGKLGDIHNESLLTLLRREDMKVIDTTLKYSKFDPEVVSVLTDSSIADRQDAFHYSADFKDSLVSPSFVIDEWSESIKQFLSKSDLSTARTYTYRRSVSPGKYQILSDGCVVSSNLVGCYALMIAVSLSPSHIFLYGFDGSGSDLSIHQETQSCIDWISRENSVSSLLPTSYEVSTLSMYSLFRNLDES